MPNGQDRYADKARKRSPRKGRTIRMGKKLGAASVEGRIEDVARELLPLMSQLSEDSWKRLDKWAVALAKARGITPDPNVIPQVEAELVRFLQDKGVFNDSNDNDSEPKVTRAQQLAGFEQRERKASEYYRFSKAVEDLENMLESARAEGKPEFVALLEERLAQLNAPGVIEHWDQWFEYYHQCNCSFDGQRRAALSSAERAAEDNKLKRARAQIQDEIAAHRAAENE